jgi:photosynthetic reaction center H subunit
MVGVTFFGDFDLASAAIWGFWLFFAALVYYLQTENMREGYPLRDDDGRVAMNQGPFPVPADKTFLLPDGGSLTVPSGQRGDREDLAMVRTSKAYGSPFEPTGDPMADGIGPAAWAPRQDVPEVDAHGHAKIRPLSTLAEFAVTSGRDPRGLTVQAGDGVPVGNITDMWVDVPEAMVRYLTVSLFDGGGERLVPINLCRIKSDRVAVRSLYGANFPGIPVLKSADQVTKLEEEKICAYYAGGTLYASPERLGPKL